MSLFRTVTRNIAANWVGFAAQVGVTFFLTPFVLASLGDARYGAWSLITSLTGYYGLLDLGFRSGLTLYTTRYLAIRDFSRLNQMASTGTFVLAAIGGLIALSTPLVAWCLPTFFLVDMADLTDIRWALIVSGTTIALQLPLFGFSAVIVAAQRYDVSNVIGISSRLITAGLTVAALKMGYGLVGVSIATSAGNLLDYLLRCRAAYRLVPELSVRIGLVRKAVLSDFAKVGVWIVMGTSGQRLISFTDSIVIAAFLPLGALAPFALAANLVQYFNRLVTPASMVFFPVATSIASKGDRESLQRLYLVGSRIVLGMSAVCGVISAVWANSFFHLWLAVPGSEVSDSPTTTAVFQILMVAAVITAGQGIGYQVLMGAFRIKTHESLILLEGIANLVLSVALVARFGAVGVAVGTLIPTVIFGGLVTTLVVSRVVGVPILRSFAAIYPRPCITAFLLYASLIALRNVLPPVDHWGRLLAYGALSLLVAVGIAIPCCLLPAERSRYIVDPLRRLFTRGRTARKLSSDTDALDELPSRLALDDLNKGDHLGSICTADSAACP